MKFAVCEEYLKFVDKFYQCFDAYNLSFWRLEYKNKLEKCMMNNQAKDLELENDKKLSQTKKEKKCQKRASKC